MGLNQDIKRGIVLLIIGIIIALFIVFNSPDFFGAGGLYIIMGVITIAGYLTWSKF